MCSDVWKYLRVLIFEFLHIWLFVTCILYFNNRILILDRKCNMNCFNSYIFLWIINNRSLLMSRLKNFIANTQHAAFTLMNAFNTDAIIYFIYTFTYTFKYGQFPANCSTECLVIWVMEREKFNVLLQNKT